MDQQISTSIVSAKGITKEYLLGRTIVPALRGIDLDVQKGEFLAISGPSGSGKTTLLNIIGLIEKPTAGNVFIDGIEIQNQNDNTLSEIRAHRIGMIFQQFNLIPVLSAYENVEYPLYEKKMSRLERADRVKKWLDWVGIGSFQNHRPMELSGGQRQRVAIARTMAASPLLVLADEPTANLDHKTGLEILELMKTINESHQTTFIFSTHDPKVMERASRIVRIADGLLC